jgi:hypothetical protein
VLRLGTISDLQFLETGNTLPFGKASPVLAQNVETTKSWPLSA